ncbi:hypothetical protein [Muricomes intestini]|uniref:hypothetical protein n=1 Tax=Muricomes intestini TaxID=1796634 RepID=UPI002FE39A52
MNEFPFPDKMTSIKILESDYVYPKIPKNDVQKIFDRVWSLGEQYGQELIKTTLIGEKWKMSDVLKDINIRIEESKVDNVVKNQRYFCEFFPKQNCLTIYKKSVQLWCHANGLEYDIGVETILSHEYFHYLEWKSGKLVSGMFTVPVIKIGKLRLGKTGIPSLSEVAANAFSKIYYEYIRQQMMCEKGGKDVSVFQNNK